MISASYPSQPAALFLRSRIMFFTSFSKTGENSKDSLILSFKYFKGKLLDFGMDLANVGPIFVKNLLNLSAMSFGSVISFFHL